MEQSSSGVLRPRMEQAVAAEGVAETPLIEVQQVTRRTALSGGATTLLGAAAAFAGVGAVGVSDAAASTADKKRKRRAKNVRITVNGKTHVVKNQSGKMLLYVLRDELHLRGPKFGCGLSQCGACAVLLDGKQIRSCVTPLSAVGEKTVLTLDGMAAEWRHTHKTKKEALHPLQQAWIDEQVPQCGYCQSGMIIQAADLLSKKTHPTTAEIKKAMNGHLCRCGTYNGIIRAIHRASVEMAKTPLKTSASKKHHAKVAAKEMAK